MRRLIAILAALATAWFTAGAGMARAATVAPNLPAQPSLAGTSLQGDPVRLADLRGQVVMLFVWSTQCPVCLSKLPELRRNLAGWRGKTFRVLALNQDRNDAELRRYAALLDRVAPPEPQMSIVWRGQPGHSDDLGPLDMRVPTTVVLGRDGRVVKVFQGRVPPELWDDIAELVLNG